MERLNKVSLIPTGKTILLKIWDKYFQYCIDSDRFLSYAKTNVTYSVGTWFKCGEEEEKRLRKAIKDKKFEICMKLPGVIRKFIKIEEEEKSAR